MVGLDYRSPAGGYRRGRERRKEMTSTAIVTKYLGPTNNRGTRIKATADGASLTLARQFNLELDADHLRVAEALRVRLGWTGKLVGGATRTGYVFVFVED